MQNKVKSYLESLKYQKGIRVLHDFHVSSIVSMYEVSVKSIRTYHRKRIIVILDRFKYWGEGNFCTFWTI